MRNRASEVRVFDEPQELRELRHAGAQEIVEVHDADRLAGVGDH